MSRVNSWLGSGGSTKSVDCKARPMTERLSPTNCHELLFDDVIWVRRARQEFDAFVDLMREHGVEVLLFHDLLTRRSRTPRRARGCCRGGCARRR